MKTTQKPLLKEALFFSAKYKTIQEGFVSVSRNRVPCGYLVAYRETGGLPSVQTNISEQKPKMANSLSVWS